MRIIFITEDNLSSYLKTDSNIEPSSFLFLNIQNKELLFEAVSNNKSSQNLIVATCSEQDLSFHCEAISKGIDHVIPHTQDKVLLSSFAQEAFNRKQKEINSLSKCTLTDLFRRETFIDVFNQQVAFHERSNKDLTLGIIDIDHFKCINDTYGHCVGDKVLKAFASALKSSLRRSDSIFRYGGEEFAVILPNTTALDAKAIMDRLHLKISKDLNSQLNIKVTFSCGLNQIRTYNDEASAYVSLADKALYQAKREGRNQTKIFLYETLKETV